MAAENSAVVEHIGKGVGTCFPRYPIYSKPTLRKVSLLTLPGMSGPLSTF
jgi:hypothetical protein